MRIRNILFLGLLLISLYSLLVNTAYAQLSGLTGSAAAKFCSAIGIPSVSIHTTGTGAAVTATYTCPFATLYNPITAGSGANTHVPLPYTGNPYVSPAAQVAAYNQQNSAYMETCPKTPPTNPTDKIYFVTGAEPFIAGDGCQLIGAGAKSVFLLSDLVYTQHYSFSVFDLAHGYSNISAENTAYMRLLDVAYSPQLESGVISTAYNSNSNIFQGVPPQPQHGLWSWFAEYANFANAPAVTKTTSVVAGVPVPSLFGVSAPSGYLLYVAPGIGYTPPFEVYPVACIYTYKYKISTTLQSIQNAEIPYVYQKSPPKGSTPGTNATFNTNFLPYILYNFQVKNPSLGNNLYTLNQLSYAAYSPYNYNNPKTSEIPINISTPQLFMASYNTNKYQQNCNSGSSGFFESIGCWFDSFGSSENSKTILVPYAMPNMIVNTMQSEPIAYPLIGEPRMYGYGATQQQLATAGANTVNAMVAIKNPLSIATIPNDYVFVLANTINPEQYIKSSGITCSYNPNGGGIAGTVSAVKYYQCVNTASAAGTCTITPPSSSSTLGTFIQGTLSTLGVSSTTNNEAFLAAIAQSYSNGADFLYNNPMGIAPYTANGINGGLSVNVNMPKSPCNAPDGTPEYTSPSQGQKATSDALSQTVSAGGATLATYNALMYGLKNNEPLSYYTTNTQAATELSMFSLSQSSSGVMSTILGTISTEIGNKGSASAAASAFVSWANGVTVASLKASSATNPNNYAEATNSIYIMRVMNEGYYNNSVLPPGSIPTISDSAITSDTSLFSSTSSASSVCSGSVTCQNVWTADWNNYWTSLIKLQSSNTYIIRQIPLMPSMVTSLVPKSSTTRTCYTSIAQFCPGSQQTFTPSFAPMNVSADSEGDVYISGVMKIGGVPSPWVIKISNAMSNEAITGTLLTVPSSSSSCTSGTTSCPQKVPTDNSGNPLSPTEISVSPDGKLLFITSQATSKIYVFSGETLKYLSTYNLVYSSDVAPLGITYQSTLSSLSSVSGTTATNPTPNVNITDFIANGGFYGLNTVNNGGIATIVNKFKAAGLSQLDEASYHHPVAIQDVNGYLYVLDNWYGGIGTTCDFHINLLFKKWCYTQSNIANFDTLMLRVINSTGQDVPVNPTKYNDVWFSTGTSASGTTNYQRYTGYQSGGIYPPFGWMISGSLSEGTSSSSGIINLCGLDSWSNPCAAIPSYYSKNNNYWPLGPAVNGLDCNSAFLVTIGSGTYGCAFLPLSGIGFSVSFNNTLGILFPSPQNINSGSSKTANQYGELLFTKFDLENYTQFLSPKGPPIVNQSVCYLNVKGNPDQLTLPSGTTNPNLCIKDNSVNSFESPILLLNSPFNYTENIGSLKTLTYSEYLYSTFSGASSITASPSSTSTNYGSTENAYNSLLSNSGFVNSGETLSNTISTATANQVASAEQTKLQSFLSGYSVVPYEETFQTEQQIEQQTMKVYPVATIYWCFTNPPTLPPFDISRTWDTLTTLFTSGVSKTFTSTPLTAPIEGGPSYAKYIFNDTFYQQALNATIIPKTLLYNLFTNRIFGTVYANYSVGFRTNKQLTVNAIRTVGYMIEHNLQGVGNPDYSATGFPYYEAIHPVTSSVSLGGTTLLPCIGAACMAGLSLGSLGSAAAGLAGGVKNTFTYSHAQVFPNAVTLFNFYQDMIYANDTYLNFTGNGQGTPGLLNDPYGYHRIVLVFNDRFNNNIYLPLDADVANSTQIGVTVTPSVSGSNSNQTTLTISGSLNYTPVLSTQQLPMKGGTVYLYYDTNLGFQHYDPYTDPANVQLCAFGFGQNVPLNCELAIPGWLYGGTTPNPNANLVTYHASSGTSGSCIAPPNSLLQPITYNCNIYGADKLSNKCSPNSGGYQWCDPVFSNGTGLCTSQLGLIGSATTDANGHFSKTITACGYGYAHIRAVFYGSPSSGSAIASAGSISTSSLSSATPEPLTAKQSPIQYAYNPSYSGTQDTFYVTDYSWAPTQSTTSFPIGALLLSYGNIGYIYILFGVIIVGILLFATKRTGRK